MDFFKRRKIERLKRMAIASPSLRSFAELAQTAPPEVYFDTIVSIAEKLRKADTIEILGQAPPTELNIDVLCKLIIRRAEPFRYSASYYAMQAMDKLDYLRKHPKHNAALLQAACEGHWSEDYESQGTEAFRRLLMDPRAYRDAQRPGENYRAAYVTMLDTVVVPEFMRRALASELSYSVLPPRLKEERFVFFLKAMKDNTPTAANALREIESAILLKRIASVQSVLSKALNAADYNEVKDMVHELTLLEKQGVPAAIEALRQFRGAAARVLSRTVFGERTDEEGYSYRVVEYTDEVSTATLGQRVS